MPTPGRQPRRKQGWPFQLAPTSQRVVVFNEKEQKEAALRRNIAAVSSSSTLCSSSSDIKEDLVSEAMFLLLCVIWGMFGGPPNLGEVPRTLPQKKAPKPPKVTEIWGFGGLFLGKFFLGEFPKAPSTYLQKILF